LTTVPTIRIRNCNQSPARPSADYVLHWMIATRHLHSNFALDRALEHCAAFAKPLLIFEALRVGYPWASDRLHRFVLDGMAENALTSQSRGARYCPYVEPAPGAGKGLLAALTQNARVVVTDDFPCFFLPRMVAAAAQKLSVRLEAVDSNGWLPIRAPEQTFLRAFDFRRLLQKELPRHLSHFPHPDPLANAKLLPAPSLPRKITSRRPGVIKALLAGQPASLEALPIDHSVKPTPLRGYQRSCAHAEVPHYKFLPLCRAPQRARPRCLQRLFSLPPFRPSFAPMKSSPNRPAAKSGRPQNSPCAPTAAAKAGGI
jgi:deoxyribodipyrimidine photo-lyase